MRTNEEVDAALAAAARAAAVPVASVHAAWPSRAARPLPMVSRPVAAVVTPASASAAHAPVHGDDNVTAAIVNAQARADKFLATGASAGATAPGAELRQAP